MTIGACKKRRIRPWGTSLGYPWGTSGKNPMVNTLISNGIFG